MYSAMLLDSEIIAFCAADCFAVVRSALPRFIDVVLDVPRLKKWRTGFCFEAKRRNEQTKFA